MSDALVVENVAIGSLAPVQVESVRGIDLPVVRLSDACFKHGDAENRYAVNSAFSLPASDEGIATVDSGPRTAVPAERGPPAGALHAVLHDNAGSGLKLENCVMDEKELASPLVLNSESEVVQRDTAEHGTEGSLPKVKTAAIIWGSLVWTISKVNVDPYPSALDRVNIGITPEVQRIESRIKELLKSKLS